MASFKALCLAGVASLAVTTAASAADLLPPQPVEAPFPPAPAMPIAFGGGGGGWYLRGDVGVGIADLNQRDSTTSYYVPGLRYNGASLDDASFIDGGVGYRVNEYFRADITGEYRASAHYSAIESYNQGYYYKPKTNYYQSDAYNGSFQSITGLVNGYVDLGTWYGVTPFVGAGVGLTRVGIGSIFDQGETGGLGYSNRTYTTNFAWALMAGLDFRITPNLTMEFGYRYLNQGTVASGAIVCQNQSPCPNEVQRFKLASNDIRLGFRYTFADFMPVAPAMPLIRKY